MGTWHQRWVELTGHELVFFHSQEDAAPSGVLPLAQVLAVAEGATPLSIVLLLAPPTSGHTARGRLNATASSAAASTAAKQRSLELQTVNGAVDGAAVSDARLQRVRWMRAIRLLIGQDVDPVSGARSLTAFQLPSGLQPHACKPPAHATTSNPKPVT